MLKLLSIASGTFQELIRQPVYLLLLAGGVAFIALLGNISYFALGDELNVLRETLLAKPGRENSGEREDNKATGGWICHGGSPLGR